MNKSVKRKKKSIKTKKKKTHMKVKKNKGGANIHGDIHSYDAIYKETVNKWEEFSKTNYVPLIVWFSYLENIGLKQTFHTSDEGIIYTCAHIYDYGSDIEKYFQYQDLGELYNTLNSLDFEYLRQHFQDYAAQHAANPLAIPLYKFVFVSKLLLPYIADEIRLLSESGVTNSNIIKTIIRSKMSDSHKRLLTGILMA